MESSYGILLLLITLAIIHIVKAQDQQGFISLDCGLPANAQSPYKLDFIGLWFSSDEKFIKSGKTSRLRENPEGYPKPQDTLRYFPDGIRNCYNLSVEKGRLYLIRATFIYGNYDGLDSGPVFDLYLGPNLWEEIDLRTVNTWKEILRIPTSNSLQICLVKTGETTPLISMLELRPMGNDSYITKSGSLKPTFRNYLNNSKPLSLLGYPNDVYDRIWISDFHPEWTQISTNLQLNNSNKYFPPTDALRNAATPTNASAPLTVQWRSVNSEDQYYFYAHFAEIQDLQANETREFNLVWDGEVISDPVLPPKLEITTTESLSPRTCNGGNCSFQLKRTNRSTLPPLLNAIEIYRVIQFLQSETDEKDVVAIKNIEATYGLSKINWEGDPCVPKQFIWDSLNCSNTDISTPPRIISLNLSSSGLFGTIAVAIQNLTQLEKLDLSNNNLNGEVPEFLGNMKSLSVINLSGNNLHGSIPPALRREGLELFVEGNPRLCVPDSCRKPLKKKVLVLIVASVASVIVIAVVILLFAVKKKKSTILEVLHMQPRTSTVDTTFANKKSKRFTYSEVIRMTNNLQRVLGKGGFGMVYHGCVNGSQEVAVKLLSHSSHQGFKEFKAEVELLLRVHHVNLVSLIGYCYEKNHLALIYEFLPNGDLKQHLSGNGGVSIINWSTRLQIALEAAQGLEYLHIGCTPAMVHRDVKTANILLDQNFKAKLADFGLSRSFQCNGHSHESTDVAGTLGYLDPEYNNSGRLSEKSDVYSFGIVLLEMITNQPVINKNSERSHITQWARFNLDRGDISGIMDPNLYGVYDCNSAWRALDLAMSCADAYSANRPNMSHVIAQLKECIVCENSRVRNNQRLESQEMNVSLDTSVVPRAR